jgi:3-phosphoshikimate 1-carboxyvinyltransferase
MVTAGRPRFLCCLARVDGRSEGGAAMGKRWAKRWTSSGPDHRRNNLLVSRITPSPSSEPIHWALPPSKSHLIRSLLLSAQSPTGVDLYNIQHAGEDARSMRRCLQQLGVKIEDFDGEGELLHQVNPVHIEHNPNSKRWRVHGVGGGGFHRPATVLSAGNSGTALRLLSTHAALIGGPVMVDGDGSLRRRTSTELWSSLEQAGVTISIGVGEERLPALLDGPMLASKLSQGITLDISRSSQPLSSWVLAAPSLPCPTTLRLEGDAVSSRHSSLSMELLEAFGGAFELNDDHLTLSPTALVPPSSYTVPGDASMAAFALLACTTTGRNITLIGWPDPQDAIGHELLQSSSGVLGVHWNDELLTLAEANEPANLDLRDANDLLPPLAAVLAMNAGGRLTGAPHAAFKESNRLTRTADLLEQFGLKATVTPDGLEIEGNQKPSRPSLPVDTYGDHRLFMTAVLLAVKCGGDIIGQNLHTIADEAFLDRLTSAGVGVEMLVLPPLND